MEYQILEVLHESKDVSILLVKNHVGKRFAMKKYKYDQHSKWGMKPEIFTELMVLNLMSDQPQILQMEEILFKRGEVRFIVEHIEGGTLANLIRQKLSPNDIKEVMSQILSGLVELHRHGIIHNDLKPVNILYHENSRKIMVKIIDFGLCYLVNFPYQRARNIKGTHHYTPPEYRNYREIGRISVNSDLFSLGVIFYYLIDPDLFAELDDNPDHHQLFDPHLIDWSLVKDRVGSHGMDLLKKMLDFQPDRRISSRESLQHPFFGRQSGGRRYEEPRLMTREEWKNPVNAESFLQEMVGMSLDMKWSWNHKKHVPDHVWDLLYEQFGELELKFETLNHSMMILHQYLYSSDEKVYDWEALVYGCLLISIKLNEYNFYFHAKSFGYHDFESILEMERKISNEISSDLLPQFLLGKEIVLYYYYLDLIYGHEIQFPAYNNYFVLNMLSSLIYTSPELLQIPKFELVKVLLNLPFKFFMKKKKLKVSKKVDTQVKNIIKKRLDHISWIDRDFINYLGLED